MKFYSPGITHVAVMSDGVYEILERMQDEGHAVKLYQQFTSQGKFLSADVEHTLQCTACAKTQIKGKQDNGKMGSSEKLFT